MHTEVILAGSRVDGGLPQTGNVGKLESQLLEALSKSGQSGGLIGARRFPSSSALSMMGIEEVQNSEP